jgi:hypothetical protein
MVNDDPDDRHLILVSPCPRLCPDSVMSKP